MNQTTLDQELQKSREAIEALREHDELRAQAEKLPQLVAEKRRQEARERSEAALEAAIAAAAPKYAELAKRAPELRKRLQTLIDSVAPLAEDIKKIQAELYQAGRPVQSAAFDYDVYHTEHQASRGDPDNGLPIELVTAVKLDESLTRSGATDPALEIAPVDMPEWCRQLLRQQHAEIHFFPKDGSRNFRGRWF